MKNRIIIGYKVKESVVEGQILEDNDLLEPVYRKLTPLEKLADMAYAYADFRNDPDMATDIDELVKKIERTTPTNKDSNK